MDRSIRFWGAVIGCLVLMAACGDSGKPPEAPNVVTQKIVVPANQPAAGGTAPAPAPAAQTPPAAAPAAPATTSPPPSAAVTPPAPVASSPAPAAPAAPVATPTPPAAPAAAAPVAAPATPDAKPPATAAVPPPLPQVPGPAAPAGAPVAATPPAPALAKEGAALPAVEADTGAAVTVAYSAEGRIDPFAPLFHAKAPAIDQTASDTSASTRKKRIAHTPLERMDISQFKLVAIVQAASGNRALVEDASGKGYVLTKGTYIGINGGIVVDIQRDKVIVEEESEDLYGRVSIQEKELKLQKPLGDM